MSFVGLCVSCKKRENKDKKEKMKERAKRATGG
jgi:hypothetical protein